MPRYHFDVIDGFRMSDIDGIDLPDLEAARRHSIALLAGLLTDQSGAFWDKPWEVCVTNEPGQDLLSVSFHAKTSVTP